MMPSADPGRVMPLMKKMVSTMYGNIDVKYTTCNNNGFHS